MCGNTEGSFTLNIRIWIDDVRPAPAGYVWCKTTNEAKHIINNIMAMQRIEDTRNLPVIEVIDTDHDAGDYAKYGGDYINVFNWLEKQEYGWEFAIHIHSMNPVGANNIRNIIRKNGWKEIR